MTEIGDIFETEHYRFEIIDEKPCKYENKNKDYKVKCLENKDDRQGADWLKEGESDWVCEQDLPKTKNSNNQILENMERLKKKAKPSGDSSHIYLPKDWEGDEILAINLDSSQEGGENMENGEINKYELNLEPKDLGNEDKILFETRDEEQIEQIGKWFDIEEAEGSRVVIYGDGAVYFDEHDTENVEHNHFWLNQGINSNDDVEEVKRSIRVMLEEDP